MAEVIGIAASSYLLCTISSFIYIFCAHLYINRS